MIAIIMIIAGAAAVIYGLIGLIRIALLPLIRAHQVVFNRNDDYLFYENAQGRRVLKSQKKFLLNIYLTLVIVGSLVAITGFYAGFTDHGQDFWLYKRLFPAKEAPRNDIINEEGQYISKEGKEYNYYILIRGSEIYFKDELCEDHTALEERLKDFDRTNTIVIHDDFAVSSEYHFVTGLLEKSGIHYIEEGN